MFPSPGRPRCVSRLVRGLKNISVYFNKVKVGNRMTFGRTSPSLAGRRFLTRGAHILRVAGRAEATGTVNSFGKTLRSVPRCYIAVKVGRVSRTKGVHLNYFEG